ncbi:MAG: tetratricopeptide repeat protein [Planctomycetota bacterium]
MSDVQNYQQGLQRAELLLSQRRFELARRQLNQMLAEYPDDSTIHAMLSMALSTDESIGEDVRSDAHVEQLNRSTEHARKAIVSDPNDPFAHYTHALVLYKRNRYEESLEATDDTLRLDPQDSDCWGLRAANLLELKRFEEALQAADHGLEVSPEHGWCLSLRSYSLERLGRLVEASGAAQSRLREDPDDSHAHCMVGYTHLNSGRHQEAKESFREALRLDPTNEFARVGMMQAISSRSLVFRAVYRYYQWISEFNSKLGFIIIIGFYVVSRSVGALGQAFEAIQPYTTAIVLLYGIAAIATWLAWPILQAMMRFDRFGKHLLSREEKWKSSMVAGVLILGAVAGCIFTYLSEDFFAVLIPFMYAMVIAILIVATFFVPIGPKRWGFAFASLVVALLPFYGLFSQVNGQQGAFSQSITWFTYGTLAIQITSQLVASRRQMV